MLIRVAYRELAVGLAVAVGLAAPLWGASITGSASIYANPLDGATGSGTVLTAGPPIVGLDVAGVGDRLAGRSGNHGAARLQATGGITAQYALMAAAPFPVGTVAVVEGGGGSF